MHSAPAATDLVASVQQHAEALREVADRREIAVKVLGPAAEEAGGHKGLLRLHLEAKQMIHPQIAMTPEER